MNILALILAHGAIFLLSSNDVIHDEYHSLKDVSTTCMFTFILHKFCDRVFTAWNDSVLSILNIMNVLVYFVRLPRSLSQ